MEFEFDRLKSNRNKSKHGLDFVEAQALWADDRQVEARARSHREPRFIVIGMIGRNCFAAVITFRDERIRIVSIRGARKEEVALYESQELRPKI